MEFVSSRPSGSLRNLFLLREPEPNSVQEKFPRAMRVEKNSFSIPRIIIFYRLDDHAGMFILWHARREQRDDLALFIRENKRTLAAAERLARAVVVWHRLGEHRLARHELIMHAVLGKILRAALADARRVALPVVQQNVVLIIRPPDGWVFEFTIFRQQIIAVLHDGISPVITWRGEGDASIHLRAVLQTAKNIDAQIRFHENRRIARVNHRLVQARPRASD